MNTVKGNHAKIYVIDDGLSVGMCEQGFSFVRDNRRDAYFLDRLNLFVTD